MKQLIWDTMKVFVIFTICTCLFYFGLKMMHAEYENYHKYDQPEGPSVKVFNTEHGIIDRMNLFFRLGE
ncbi:YqzK family protein [Oceanobacillus salinisoli]|uniref:YqzK family protein n=1 Tax=Oceanobacillus salinisoli TaxID=2678611 RepID=UPI0012E309C2|nr:YqzK family protein [Oceanobacillus salinisoli]